MIQTLGVQLFVRRDQLQSDHVRQIVRTLLSVGFGFDIQPNGGGRYAVEGDWSDDEPKPLAEALDALPQAVHWAIDLHKQAIVPPPPGNPVNLLLSVEKTQHELDIMRLSASVSTTEPTLTLFAQEFHSWAMFLANICPPWYGWGGLEYGLYNPNPISIPALLKLDLMPLEWLNVLGVEYVQVVGLERLMSVPAWQTQFLLSGGIEFTLAKELDVPLHDIELAAGHLGLPFRRR